MLCTVRSVMNCIISINVLISISAEYKPESHGYFTFHGDFQSALYSLYSEYILEASRPFFGYTFP